MATKRWIGAAQDVAQEDTITIGGTWTSAETATVTCNNKSVTITTGSSIDTTTEVAAALAHAMTLTHHDADQISNEGYDYTLNMGGYEVGEFRDMEVSVSGSVITVKSRVPGVPFTITVAEGSTSGTIALATGGSGASVVATGKNHFDNADNWDDGAAPSTGDVLHFDHDAPSVLYGLDNAATDLRFYIGNAYKGNIGLPKVNGSNAGYQYAEYRQRHLDVERTSTTGVTQLFIGDRVPLQQTQGRRYFDLGTNTGTTCDVHVYDAGPATDDGPSVQILGGREIDMITHGGSSAYGNIQGGNACQFDTVQIAARDARSAPTVTLDGNTTLNSGSTLQNDGGTLDMFVNGSNCTANLYGGTTTNRITTTSFGTVHVREGATLKNYDGTITNLYVYAGGALDASLATGYAVTNATVYRGATIRDPNNQITWTNGIDYYGCSLQDVHHTTGEHLTWTPSAI